MIVRWIVFTLLLLAGAVEASITVGWKLPIEGVLPEFRSDKEVRKLDKAPGESVFFQAGDELWDVSEALGWEISLPLAEDGERLEKWPGEWIVWNARAGMFVARGFRDEVLMVQKALGLDHPPAVMRIRAEWVEGGSKRAFSVVARRDEEAKLESDGVKLHFEGNSNGDGIIGQRFTASWQAGEDLGWSVRTDFMARDGERTLVACHGEGEKRWEFFMTASEETSYGIPLAEVRWSEGPAGMLRCPVTEKGDAMIHDRIEDGREVRVHLLAPDAMARAHGGEWRASAPMVDAPPELTRWVRGRVRDVRGLLAQKGIEGIDTSRAFAGFDEERRRLIVAADAAVQGPCEEVAMMDHGLRRDDDVWIETKGSGGGFGIIGGSGQSASITAIQGKKQEERTVFEVLASEGGGATVQVGYKLDMTRDGTGGGVLESAVRLEKGVAKEIFSKPGGGGGDDAVVITATARSLRER